jgi:hypothetical protein
MVIRLQQDNKTRVNVLVEHDTVQLLQLPAPVC